MARKNPHAVALGKLGGKAKSPAKLAAIRRNGQLGGRPRRYRLVGDTLERRDDAGRWIALEPPYDPAARAYLYRQAHRPS